MALTSQLREITVFMSGNKFWYVIPMFRGLESVLGANLEIEMDLSQSAKLHRIYGGIKKNHEVQNLTPIPKNTIPTELSLRFERQQWKTILKAEEVRLTKQDKVLSELV